MRDNTERKTITLDYDEYRELVDNTFLSSEDRVTIERAVKEHSTLLKEHNDILNNNGRPFDLDQDDYLDGETVFLLQMLLKNSS